MFLIFEFYAQGNTIWNELCSSCQERDQPITSFQETSSQETKEMEDKIRDETDFNTTLDNPIELLIRIEGFMTKTDDGSYDFIHFWEGNKKFFNI